MKDACNVHHEETKATKLAKAMQDVIRGKNRINLKWYSRAEAYTANMARRNGATMEIAFTVFSPTLSAEFPVAVLVGTGRVLVSRLVRELELVSPLPFSLFAFLTNASKFSQSESFMLMAPTPPSPHPQMS